MKLTVEINDMDYGALIAMMLPIVRDKLAEQDGTAAAILSKLAKLPPDTARKMVNLLPRDTQDEIVVLLLNKNKGRVISAASDYAGKNGLSFRIDDFKAE